MAFMAGNGHLGQWFGERIISLSGQGNGWLLSATTFPRASKARLTSTIFLWLPPASGWAWRDRVRVAALIISNAISLSWVAMP